jgi:TonB family protein
VRQILESKFVNREVEQQPDASTSERGDLIRTEPDQAVIQELKHEQPEVVVSNVTTPIVSQVIAQQVTELETTSRNTEMSSRSVQDAANSILDSDVNPDGSQRQKPVVPGTVESPSHAPAIGAADSTSAPDVDTDGETMKHEVRSVPGTEVPSHAPEVSPPTQMGTSSAPGREKEGSVRNMASASRSGKGTGPDYGWLRRLLWERINRIKHYSDEAFDKEWEGRVVMVVTVWADGRIDDVNVAESSGNRSLDREAVNLIARVSPLELDRALGAERVKLRVPISFGLE